MLRFRAQRSGAKVEQLLALPDMVEGGKVEAAYKDGVLRITLPKKPAARRKPVAVEVT